MSWKQFAKATRGLFSSARYSRTLTGALTGSSLLVLLQFNFLRQLLAAELLVVVLVLIPSFVLAAIIYAIGLASDLGFHAIAERVQSFPATRRRHPL